MFSKKGMLVLWIFLCMGSIIYAQSKGNIVFVSYQTADKIDPETGDYPDMPYIYLLEDQGYDVTIFYNAAISTASEATLDTLYEADLIIYGRSTPSTSYGDHKQTWNDITTPTMNVELWNARSNRLNWFNSDAMVSLANEGTLYNALIDVPDDPVFEGLDTSVPMPWCVGPIDACGVTEAGNGTVMARMETDSTVFFVRWEPDIEFYDGAGDFPAGPRTLIGNGRDNGGVAPFDYYNFTIEGEIVFLAEVARMVAISTGGSAVNDRESDLPSNFELSQNYPNPFNPTTKIPFHLHEKSHVRLSLFNILGEEILTIADNDFDAGYHEVMLDASHLAAGVYVYKMHADGYIEVKKLAVIK
ncbi:T9SS type A sorting domain-containing protein [candidate division KSB1 bacterium]|nr:T9SS type A sorting domain-containing protein [candidate division KSB1 bacterium]